ncbi:tyrosine recombinase XerC [Clostridium cellulovorans]|uniref:Integrase family protein n=1 Tax=Clostridium cellulovorans (strain ATCC 35296 / DSM 3052 / OCM 3 / 743B) TaxID=573061 RepID=D9SX20_CLOC7|nr:tyrosine-type recombinase/integrase [Clostridium cellulovorans]ADL51381.1 integrase family protein [Clostridium cellulovorans 743B]
MQSNKTCPLVEQYLGYLSIIKNRSENTILEYRIDLLMFFSYILKSRSITVADSNFAQIDLEFIKSINLNDMYSFISYCQKTLNSSAGTRARKIVSIRQFWKYLKTKAHVIDNNIAEELETPKLPKRIPKYLNLEKSFRLLMECKKSIRDHCIITIFLNCALRLSELASLNIDQVNNDTLSVVGKGNKERKIFLTPAAKKAINNWLHIRNSINVDTNALFISRNSNRITTRAIQNIIKKYVLSSGLDSKSISTHKLRHTAATLMYKYGRVDIRSLQQILGHESVATTEIYTHIYEHQLQSAVNSNPLAMMFT